LIGGWNVGCGRKVGGDVVGRGFIGTSVSIFSCSSGDKLGIGRLVVGCSLIGGLG
jgi:hypothetical protein